MRFVGQIAALAGLAVAVWLFWRENAAGVLALMRAAGAVLLDMRPDAQLFRAVRDRLEQGADRIADLHLWRVGPEHNALIATIVSHEPRAPSVYKELLSDLPGLSHVTIEVECCA